MKLLLSILYLILNRRTALIPQGVALVAAAILVSPLAPFMAMLDYGRKPNGLPMTQAPLVIRNLFDYALV